MNVREFYEGAPLEALFGRRILPEYLNASALSKGLDAIGAATGKTRLQWDLSQKAKRRFGFDLNIDHGDGNDGQVHRRGAGARSGHEVAVSMFGHPKIKDDK